MSISRRPALDVIKERVERAKKLDEFIRMFETLSTETQEKFLSIIMKEKKE